MHLISIAVRRSVKNLMSGYGVAALVGFICAIVYFYFVKCRSHQAIQMACVREYSWLTLTVAVAVFVAGTVLNAVKLRRGGE
jgi:hypothetical protein